MTKSEKYTEEETARRRDEVVRHMANTPPQPKLTPVRPQGRKKKAGLDHVADKDRARRDG